MVGPEDMTIRDHVNRKMRPFFIVMGVCFVFFALSGPLVASMRALPVLPFIPFLGFAGGGSWGQVFHCSITSMAMIYFHLGLVPFVSNTLALSIMRRAEATPVRRSSRATRTGVISSIFSPASGTGFGGSVTPTASWTITTTWSSKLLKQTSRKG
jgi:hypothetical protein